MGSSSRSAIRWAIAAGAACACARGPAPAADYYPVAGRSDLPFSEITRANGFLFVSGQVGTDNSGAALVPGGIAAETARALVNLGSVLERHGSSLDHVLKCTVLLADMKEWPAMNRVYAGYFPRHFPARTAFGGAQLVFGARVEFDCVAAGAR